MTGSFHTSDRAPHRAGVADGALRRARVAALARFEIAEQLREPLTTLYALVFFWLAFGYAASNAVELVSARGSVPRTAPWALMLAFGGLTAFGQVITTMIATTAMLRDEAQRTRALIATSGVGPRVWFVARTAAALALMALVYAAMPLGVVLGAAVRATHEVGAAPLAQVAVAALAAYAVITVPTVIVVTLLLASAAARTQRVVGVLVAALVLVALWQLALTLVGHPATALGGALLDPFGNAPVIAMTAHWSPADRASRPVPLSGLLLANRLLWLSLASAVVATLLGTRARHFFSPLPPADPQARPRAFARLLRRLARATSARTSLRHFTAGWITLDGGWRIVAALAVLNAGANAMSALRRGDAATVLSAVSGHSRLFFILLATVYAGELVWRERDARVDPLLGTIGVSRGAYVVGRVLGLLQAQLAVLGPLALLALLLALLAAPQPASVMLWGAWSILVLWLPMVLLTLVSLLVHALLRHKVAAHLLLITGWVAWVTLDTRVASVTWSPTMPLATSVANAASDYFSAMIR